MFHPVTFLKIAHDQSVVNSCNRVFMPNGKSKFEPLGSCTKLQRTSGDVFAIMHPHKKTGYKAPNSETNLKMLGNLTSYKEFYIDKVDLPTMPKKSGTTYKQKLVPYNPNSIVNQLPVHFSHEPTHGIRFCAPRNVSQVEIGKGRYERQFVTTSQTYYVEHQGLPVGFTNQGIMSDHTKMHHRLQNL